MAVEGLSQVLGALELQQGLLAVGDTNMAGKEVR